MAKKKKDLSRKEEKEFVERKKSLQEMLPIKDVADGCFVNEHKQYFPVIELGSINFDLMSKDEREKLVNQLIVNFGSFNFNEYQVLIVPMPFDIERWLSEYDDRYEQLLSEANDLKDKYDELVSKDDKHAFVVADDIHFNQKMQIYLKNEINFVIQNIVDGGMTTKKSFFIPFIKDSRNKADVLKAASTVVSSFKSIGIDAKLCSDLELRTLLVVTLNPKNPELIKPKAGKSVPVRKEFLQGGN